MSNYALITGASSGIGEEFAKQLAEQGKSLIIVARSKSRLMNLTESLHGFYKVDIHPLVLDLTHRGAPEKLLQYCVDNRLKVDLLINNAGIGRIEAFLDHDIEEIHEMLTLNVEVLTKLTHLFLPHLIKNKGTLLNVASQAAFQPQPYLAAYAATKAYVLNFTEALRVENEGKGVNICTLCPGPTYTNFFARAGTTPKKINFKFRMPQEVVKIALEGIRKKKSIIIIGFENSLMTFLNRFFPRRLVAKLPEFMINKNNNPPKNKE